MAAPATTKESFWTNFTVILAQARGRVKQPADPSCDAPRPMGRCRAPARAPVATRRVGAYHAGTMAMETPPQDPARADRLAHYLLRSVNKAVRRHRLLGDGDRILVAVSGGKDSLTLLDLLYRRQRQYPDTAALCAGLVRSDIGCGRAVPEAWLARWCAERGIPLGVEEIAVADEVRASGANACFRCSRQRRRALFALAGRFGCRTVALGHHADDVAETALMNLIYSATFAGMAPRREYPGGFALIRPLIYTEERDIAAYARACGYPLTGEPCPAGAHTKRTVARALLRQAEQECHGARRNILAALERAAGTGEGEPADESGASDDD